MSMKTIELELFQQKIFKKVGDKIWEKLKCCKILGDSDVDDIAVLMTLWWWLLNRSPTSQTCHEHIWSPTSVNNIDVTKFCRQHHLSKNLTLSWYPTYILNLGGSYKKSWKNHENHTIIPNWNKIEFSCFWSINKRNGNKRLVIDATSI